MTFGRYLFVYIASAGAMARAEDTFEERVAVAKAIEQTPVGAEYQDRMWPQIKPVFTKVMSTCIEAETSPELVSFVLVATVTASGRLVDIEVQPLGTISQCFAGTIGRITFPVPPNEFGAAGIPLTFNMLLHKQ